MVGSGRVGSGSGSGFGSSSGSGSGVGFGSGSGSGSGFGFGSGSGSGVGFGSGSGSGFGFGSGVGFGSGSSSGSGVGVGVGSGFGSGAGFGSGVGFGSGFGSSSGSGVGVGSGFGSGVGSGSGFGFGSGFGSGVDVATDVLCTSCVQGVPPRSSRTGGSAVRRLASSLTAPDPSRSRPLRPCPWLVGMRRILPGLLLALAALLLPLAVVSVWADGEIDDTDRYVSTMAPLADDADVQQAVATRLTTEIMQKVDLGPLQGGAGRLLGDAVRSFTGTDAYQKAWNTVSRVTHDAFRSALTAPQGSGDAVTLDLAPVTEELKARLTADEVPLAGQIPVVHTDITLVTTDHLDEWRTAYDWLVPAARWLPWVVVVLVVGAVALAVRGSRLRTLALAGLAFLVGALLLALLLAVAHNLVLSDLPEDIGRPAAEAVYSTLTASLRTVAWVMGAAGLVGTVIAWGAVWLTGRREPPTRSDHSSRGRDPLDTGWSA